MGRMYHVKGSGSIGTSDVDLFEINAPSDAIVVLHEFRLYQASDFGDAEEEATRIHLERGYTTSGSGGSTPTPAPLQAGYAAFGGTVEMGNTTLASGGTPVTQWDDGWNIRIPLLYVPTPETRSILSPSGRWVIRFEGGLADSVTGFWDAVIEEIGG